MVGRLHTDIYNVPTHFLPGIRMQLKFTKAKRDIYLMSKEEDSNAVFKFLDAQLMLKRVRPNPAYLTAHNTGRAIAKDNLNGVELKTFTFASGSQSVSNDKAILRPIPKRLLFAMMENKHFLGSVGTNPFKFHHYDTDSFSLYNNGKQIPSGGLHLNTDNEKGSCHGIQDALRGDRHSSLERRYPDMARHVRKQIYHVTLRSDA